ncbi:MAG: hypothetical protein ACP5O6_08735 [Candidatus Baltobacteraceae bacterium]
MTRRLIALVAALAIIWFPIIVDANSGTELTIPINRCFHEKFPVGSGLGVGSKRDIAVNRNLIYASDMLVLGNGDPRRGNATALGYFLHVANGIVYYEPANNLTIAQRGREATALHYLGLGQRQINFLLTSSGDDGVIALPHGHLHNPPGLRIVHCASLGENQ